MPIPQRSDYNELLKKSQELISSGKAKSITDLSRILNVQRSSLMSLFERNFGVISFDDIMKARPKVETDKDQKNLIGPEHADAAEVEIDGNEGVIRSVVVVDQIKTIEQLMKLTGTDKEFVVHNPKVKKWDVALKVKEGKDQEIVKVVPSTLKLRCAEKYRSPSSRWFIRLRCRQTQKSTSQEKQKQARSAEP